MRMYRNFDTGEIFTEEEVREAYELFSEETPDETFEIYMERMLEQGRQKTGGLEEIGDVDSEEDAYDLKVAIEAHEEYVKSGYKSQPIEKLWEELNI